MPTHTTEHDLQLGQLIITYTPKNVLPLAFFSNTEKESFPESVLKDLVVFDSQNKPEKNSSIGVQGDCPYILFSFFSKLL